MKKILLISLVIMMSVIWSVQSQQGSTCIILHQKGISGPRPRSIMITPMDAFYVKGSIRINFREDIGRLTVLVINHSTGEQWFEMVDSADGSVDIDVANTPGDYTVDVETESGTIYTGYFTL